MVIGYFLSGYLVYRHSLNQSVKHEAELLAEIEKLKLANVATAPLQRTASVDYSACLAAQDVTQAPAYLLAAIRRVENGRQGRELGYNGKDAYVVGRMAVEQWQYGAAGRLATKVLWQWAASDPERFKDYVETLAATYYGHGQAGNHDWAKQVRALAKQERAHLSTDRRTTTSNP